jgi:chloramphenicol O-acetyltransferase type A
VKSRPREAETTGESKNPISVPVTEEEVLPRRQPMKYRVVGDYYRQAQFDFFNTFASPYYNLTFPLDCTKLKAVADERGYSTYVNLCYFFVKGMQGIEDFRYRYVDGRLVLYEELHLGLTVPAPNGLFSFQYLTYDSDWESFNRTASTAAHSAVELVEKPDPNYVYLTALPGVHFTSLTHPVSSTKTDGQTKVCFGKFARVDGRLLVPVGIQVNHLFIDGVHLGALVERVQGLYDDPR